MRFVVLMFGLIMFGFCALAQVPSPTPEVLVPVISNEDFIGALLQSMGGFQGASTLVIAGIVVQLLLKFLGTQWAGELLKDMPGKTKIIIVSVLSIGAAVLGLMAGPAGLSLGAALVHSSVLTALMVYGNQIIQQFSKD